MFLSAVADILSSALERRRAEEALRATKEEAEKANAAKSDFLSRISHELRTPLNAILGFGQLLEISELVSGDTESVDHIMRAGRHLLGLIDEVLAISRIESGRIHLSLEPVAAGGIVRECLSLVGRQAEARKILCDDRGVAVAGGGDRYLRADRQRLRQVLLNLLSNAVKYNRPGGRISVSCHELPAMAAAGPVEGESESPSGWLQLEVTDTGLGLTAEEMGRLFTPFERLEAERGPTEGTGLGLALSKGLVEAMGGVIGVRSVVGEGSTFWLQLPMAAEPQVNLESGLEAAGDPFLYML